MQTELKLKEDKLLEKKVGKVKAEMPFWKRIPIYTTFLVIAFFLGLFSMWLSERETAQQRDAARINLRMITMENRFASAIIKVRRGEYESARIAAGNFFTDLRAEISRKDTAFNAKQLEAVKPILAQRDELINLLAQKDPSIGDRLAELYLTFAEAN